MGTAIKHPVPDRAKPSFVIVDIRALWRCPDVNSYKWLAYSCTNMATVGVKGLTCTAVARKTCMAWHSTTRMCQTLRRRDFSLYTSVTSRWLPDRLSDWWSN